MQRLTAIALSLLTLAPPLRAEGVACGTHPDAGRWLLALHRQHRPDEAFAASRHALSDDDDLAPVGHIAVFRDRGDLLVRKNPFDLDTRGTRFVPGAAGYGVVGIPPRVPANGGETLISGRDEPRRVALPFAFPFFGREYRELYVHADGYLSFEPAPPFGGDRSLPRFLSGPPAIAVFFADFAPDRGGTVSWRATASDVVVTWADLAGSTQVNQNTFHAVLAADGSIDLLHTRMESREGVVGVTPGRTIEAVPRDLSAGVAAAQGAVAEVFSEAERLDLISAVRRFYRAYPDTFEQVVVYTTRPMNPLGGSFAFEVNVKNDTRGIGLDVFDTSGDWGSAGALESVVFMDSLEPYREVDGFEILGHEVSHRWLARLRFRDAQGATSTRLLGGDLLHWSFFLDSDASLIGGNDIAEVGGGFETVDFSRRYSALDQYVMGLRGPEEVPPFFIVEGADRFRPNRGYKSSSSPEAGVRFTGRRTAVTISDVIAALGPRVPDASRSPRVLRQAFLLIGDAEAPPDGDRVAVIDRIRGRFEAFYDEATGGRGRVDTRLP